MNVASKKATEQRKSPWITTGFSLSISFAKHLILRPMQRVCCISYYESTEFES